MQLNQPAANGDHVDRVRQQWAAEMPDLDTMPIAVIARLGRAGAYVETGLHTVFADYGLTRQGWDILVSVRRSGPPYRLSPTELHRALMRTSGAITHTLHRLEYAGLIERIPDEHDGRGLLVTLTPEGTALVNEIAPRHLANERRMLAALTADEQATLADLLRKLLLRFERDQAAPPAAPRSGVRSSSRSATSRGAPAP